MKVYLHHHCAYKASLCSHVTMFRKTANVYHEKIHHIRHGYNGSDIQGHCNALVGHFELDTSMHAIVDARVALNAVLPPLSTPKGGERGRLTDKPRIMHN